MVLRWYFSLVTDLFHTEVDLTLHHHMTSFSSGNESWVQVRV